MMAMEADLFMRHLPDFHNAWLLSQASMPFATALDVVRLGAYHPHVAAAYSEFSSFGDTVPRSTH
jgi:hypothetical protein